jgi:type IV secretory pathway VirB2 component (pilin)
MSILKNLKEPISNMIGVAIITVTTIMLYQVKITWQWEGIIGVGVGCFLFFVPDAIIVDSLVAVFKKVLNLIGIKDA